MKTTDSLKQQYKSRNIFMTTEGFAQRELKARGSFKKLLKLEGAEN